MPSSILHHFWYSTPKLHSWSSYTTIQRYQNTQNTYQINREMLKEVSPTIINLTPAYILSRVNTHSIQGFLSAIKSHLLNAYEAECAIQNCYMSVSVKDSTYYIQLFAVDHLNWIKASVHISGLNYSILSFLIVVYSPDGTVTAFIPFGINLFCCCCCRILKP